MTDQPSNRKSVRPTVRPVLQRRKTNIVLSATTSTLFIATTKVAAVGRHHKRGGAASGRATSFVVSFVLALNRVNIVAVTTILVLHVGVIGHHSQSSKYAKTLDGEYSAANSLPWYET